ncbi:hypothetical protein [Streptosporangium jomthongense]|uniref:Uncharacterized protein n=1 Tax=Streptosporangium jomthongense TaxID=1193683 RepID=A0ABV8FFT2_9ACTN
MALSFVTEPDGDAGHVTATARLCLTEDRDRLVPDTDPDARWLYCVPGQPISRAEAERYGLLGESPEGGADAETKQAPPAANKARGRSADK